jgi:uncharacterized membrane protein YbhN (UPF0104 family)
VRPLGRELAVARSIPWTQVALSAGVVGVIVWRVPFAGLQAAFRNLELGSLLLAVFCFLVLLFLRAYKWHRLLAAVGKTHVRQSLRSLFGGFALGLITPGRLGELARCVFVREEERAQVALLTLLDRLLDLWALFTLVGASLFLLVPQPAAVFGVAVWLASLPVVMGFPRLLAHLSKMARKPWRFRWHLTEAAAELPHVQTPRFAFLAVGAMWAELASFFFLLRAFFPAGFTTAVATYPYIVLAGDLPLSFSGMGVREGVAALLLSPYAVPSGAAVDAALLWFVFAILLPAVLGSLWLLAERAKSHVRDADIPVPDLSRLIRSAPAPQPHGPLHGDSVAPRLGAG